MRAETRRVRAAALAVLLALTVGACGSPWAKGTNSTSTSSTAADNATQNAGNSAGNSADAPSVTVTVPGADTAPAPAAANPAPNPAAPAAPTGGTSLPAADALSPSAQAEYCKRTSPLEIALPSEDGVRQSTSDLKSQSQIFGELAGYSPSELHSDVALLATDYQALAEGSRTLPQVDGEVRTSFGRVVGYRNLICLTDEERQKQAGN
ncbi:MAG TPA: hypothetical protein VH141_15860 [Pseudonocardia sp.]|jgi:hypothetical protein|nr:hypothetical protein [Pseudonocardia sp.]